MARKTGEEVSSEPFLSLLVKAQNGDRKAEELLLNQNSPLVQAIVRRYTGRGTDTEDLRQLGMIGLWKAVQRFNPAYGVCFSTYAVPLIAGEIKRFLRDDGMVKFSRASKQLAARVSMLAAEHGQLSLHDLAAHFDCTEEDIAMALSSRSIICSLDTPVSDGSSTLGELQASTDIQEHTLDKIYLDALMTQLDKRERLLLQLRFHCDLTQKETAARLTISQVQVSRLEKRIMEKLRLSQKSG